MKASTKMFIITACLLGCYGCKEEAIQEYSILPEPQQMEYVSGTFKVKDGIRIAFPSELASEAALASQYLSADFGISAILKEGKKSGNITLLLDASVLPEHPEGYILDIKKKGIVIKAKATDGILYGIQTLRQLVRTENGKLLVQTGTIIDYPTFGWRAFMLDDSRYFHGKEAVYRLLDNMSRLKMNVFHWHLTDYEGWRIEIKKYPDLTKIGAYRDSTVREAWWRQVGVGGMHIDRKPHGGFYTQNDIKEIVAYAAARNITIVPEIEMPGHAYAAIASYPWLGTARKNEKPGFIWGQNDLFDVTDPKVITFFHDVLTEVMALFPGQVIHIGGDEVDYTNWKQSASVNKYMKENGIKSAADLQIDFTSRMSQWITSKNRRMMGWYEITGAKIHGWQKAEDNVTEKRLAPGTIVHYWEGSPNLAKKAIEDGYDVVNSHNQYTYMDFIYKILPLEKAYSFNPIPDGLTDAQKKKVLGIGCQLWSEFVPDEKSINYKVYPRIAAYAETGWISPDKKDYNRFLKALDYFLNVWKQQGIEYGPLN
ncbi:MAG: beta-N-acetylhexosaminidase [Tannerella sp.]|jgi:hexosaminidase|nr:beta-N-acetylhexosaminidase [Tannerella sp.]